MCSKCARTSSALPCVHAHQAHKMRSPIPNIRNVFEYNKHTGCAHIKRTKYGCTHQAHDVCVCATSAPNVRAHNKRTKCVHMHTKRARCARALLNVCSVLDHTKRTESACVHQAYKVHVCASSARNVRVAYQAHVLCACTLSAQSVYMHAKRTECARAHRTYAMYWNTLSARNMCVHINLVKYARVHKAHKACPCRPSAPSAYAHQAHEMCAYGMCASLGGDPTHQARRVRVWASSAQSLRITTKRTKRAREYRAHKVCAYIERQECAYA